MSDVPLIDMRTELIDRHIVMLEALHRLSRQVPSKSWALVGGLMVVVIGHEHGTSSWRASQTKDADVVVDVVSDPAALGDVTHALQAQGFTLEQPIGSGDGPARCTFSFYRAQIDVLCPDDASPTDLDTSTGLRSVAMPGGRHALRTARTVDLLIGDDHPEVRIRIPSPVGALLAKTAAATDPRTRDGERHIQDVAFLLSLPFDLEAAAAQLSATGRALLEQIGAMLAAPESPAWEGSSADERARALAAHQRLMYLAPGT